VLEKIAPAAGHEHGRTIDVERCERQRKERIS
jgi:hypothetical protein